METKDFENAKYRLMYGRIFDSDSEKDHDEESMNLGFDTLEEIDSWIEKIKEAAVRDGYDVVFMAFWGDNDTWIKKGYVTKEGEVKVINQN